MELERALKRYDSLKTRRENELMVIRESYFKRARDIVDEILSRLEEFEVKKPPGKVDPHLLKIVLRERSAYVSTLRRILGTISSMDDLGRKLAEMSKLHIGYGRYLIALFEKDVYRINRLLKELGELYSEYSAEIMRKTLPKIDIRGTLREIEEVKKEISQIEEELKTLKRTLSELKRTPEGDEELLKEALQSREALEVKVRTIKIEIRSKASKLQKPIKRMRIPEAAPFLRDSSYAIENPYEFLKLVERVYPNLDGKGKKAAEWLIKNLQPKVEEIREIEGELSRVKQRVEELKSRYLDRREEARRIEERIIHLQEELRKQRNWLGSLEERLREEVEALEHVIGKSIELRGG